MKSELGYLNKRERVDARCKGMVLTLLLSEFENGTTKPEGN